MRDLGYRKASAQVLQGVSIDGDNLIITFQVNEGPLTRIAGVEVKGNKIYTDERIRRQLRTVINAPYSRHWRGPTRIVWLHSTRAQGYWNARIDFSIVELPKKGDDEQVRLVYTIADEGEKVFINKIVINGVTGSQNTRRTKRQAIRRAIPLTEGDILRADRVSDAERELYLTDAYRQVIIRTEPAGETTSGYRQRDVIIDVEEKQPNVMDYGGGFSTDAGALGLFEISNVNLMNRLRQERCDFARAVASSSCVLNISIRVLLATTSMISRHSVLRSNTNATRRSHVSSVRRSIAERWGSCSGSTRMEIRSTSLVTR